MGIETKEETETLPGAKIETDKGRDSLWKWGPWLVLNIFKGWMGGCLGMLFAILFTTSQNCYWDPSLEGSNLRFYSFFYLKLLTPKLNPDYELKRRCQLPASFSAISVIPSHLTGWEREFPLIREHCCWPQRSNSRLSQYILLFLPSENAASHTSQSDYSKRNNPSKSNNNKTFN